MRGVAERSLGRGERGQRRLPRRGLRAADRPDHPDGGRLVLHPARGLCGRAALPASARCVRGGGRAERVPAGEHRHLRDVADVRRDDPGRGLRGRSRRGGRAEDFFAIAGVLVYVYLFLSVPSSFELQLGQLHDHALLTIVIVVGGAALVVALGRLLWRRLQGLWRRAKEGGAVLGRRRDYLVQVVTPSFG